MSNQFLKNKIVKNASWIIIGKILQMGISLFVGILTTRYLGPSNYGLINYAAAYTAFFSSLSTLGINSVIVKELLDNKENEGEVIGTALGLRALSSVLSVIVIIAISFVLDREDPITLIVVALYSLGLVFNIFEVFNYWFQAKLESKKSTIASIIAYSLMAIYKVYLLATNKSVIYFSVSMSIEYIFIALILFLFYKQSQGKRLSFSLEYGINLLKKSYHFILPGLMVAVYGQTDKIMLKHMFSELETGYYSTATTLCGMWCFILTAIIDSITPSIMQLFSEDMDAFNKMNRRLYSIVFYVSSFVSIVFTIFGDCIILLLYGEAYLPAAQPLKIITWYTAFSYLGVARNAWIVCNNKQSYLKYIYFYAAAVNVILNLIFIPIWGTSGAAIASLIAQFATTIVFPLFIKELRENSKLMIEAILLKDFFN